jgi:hypothetical protein
MLNDYIHNFVQTNRQDRAFEQATQIIACDEQSEEPPYASEGIIQSAWEHASRMIHDPSSVARSLPWDAFAREFSREGLHPDDAWVLGDWKPVGYLDGLLESNVLWDSDVGNGEENEDMEEEENGVDGNEDSQNDDNDFDEEEYYYKNDSDDYDDDGYKRGINTRLNGKQLLR